MKNLKILAVEDNPSTRLLVQKKLQKAGYEVRTAGDGVEAVGILSEYFFDVILTDLIMPGNVDGMDVLEKAKERHKRTEVILLTAHATVESAVKAMKKGAADYIEKPINFDELILRLDRISDMKSVMEDAVTVREAMDLTEQAAARTIQDLEIAVSNLQQTCSAIKETLSSQNLDAQERVRLALEMLPLDS
jgi:DNA-binding NtrC family response regulator